jgi:hypothetical protein
MVVSSLMCRMVPGGTATLSAARAIGIGEVAAKARAAKIERVRFITGPIL